MYSNNSYPQGPYNSFVYYISKNPITSFNPVPIFPKIDSTAFIGPFSSVIGDVTINEQVYVAPNVSVRADEGTPFYIGPYSNLQDGVILHGLKNERLKVGNTDYSIYIGKRVSVAHDALVHGPCVIGNQCFVGFKAIVFNTRLGNGVYVSPGAVITSGVKVPDNRFIPPGALIDTQEKAYQLKELPIDKAEFAEEVEKVNTELNYSYSMMFGKRRCTCGLACD
ncbi:LbetaH domain-containing protein [Haloplasma contractile]|uniref:Carbonate dehydratase protein n=1 Tax=Haloplasma contractile SSD-17B TaxID=1033810 RepID=F7Q204_9MOLU|nr:carbonate dehydratase [Haloplasma contractile]ERJ12188.1 Carbonate dehydratase protein [Haloplasma contractile SSD-17B]